MDFNIDVRLKQLDSLEQYIASSRDKVQSILDCLKWDEAEVMKETQLIRCSIDHNHRVDVKSVDEHVKKCALKKQGYDMDEEFLSEPAHDPASSIIIDDHKKIEIFSVAHKSIPDFKGAWDGQEPDPKTANRVVSTFSPYERSALYKYAVENTIGPPKLPEFNTIHSRKLNDKPLTYEELRTRERDARRRRIKYKSVHTNRKSHKEVMREVIDQQMEMYTDWLMDGEKSEEKCEEESPNIKQEEEQKSGRSSAIDFNECLSVASRNSTHSGSSKSIRKRSKDRSEYNHHKRYDSRDYKKSSNSREHKRRRSKDRYDNRKYEKSYSRYDNDNRKRYGGYKER